MIELIGRKLLVGDVLELPHLADFDPLDQTIPVSVKRYYQVTDGNYASEGFSSTWYPHLWRIKCEPLVDSQEFKQITNAPINQDNYLGMWDPNATYPPGYVITFGGENYVATTDVPVGTMPITDGVTPDPYWQLDPNQTTGDIVSRYNKNIAINDAALAEARRQLPLSGYDTSNLFVLPTYGPDSEMYNEPANSSNVSNSIYPPSIYVGIIGMMRSPDYKSPSPVLSVPADSVDGLLTAFLQMSLESVELSVPVTDTGSGSVEKEYAILAYSMGPVTGPYGTSDNTYASSDQNPAVSGFTGTVTPSMDFRADCDPAYQYIVRQTPRSFGYTVGYLTGTANAPNGLPCGSGTAFPASPKVGDYFLRIDYFPQALFRWDTNSWVRISENVRTGLAMANDPTKPLDQTQRASFTNNKNQTPLTGGGTTPEKQGLSTILRADHTP